MDYGIDTNRTFEMKDLLIFTDNLEVKTNIFLSRHQLFFVEIFQNFVFDLLNYLNGKILNSNYFY
jgi:hypothetical protein